MTAHLSDESHRLAPWRRWLAMALDAADEYELVDTALRLLHEGVEYDEGKAVQHAVALSPICTAQSLAERLEIAATLLRRRLARVNTAQQPLPTSDKRRSDVDVDLLAGEIAALQEAARRHARAIDAETAAGAGLDLETAAIRYVRKLDDEYRKAHAIDYAAIAAAAEPTDN